MKTRDFARRICKFACMTVDWDDLRAVLLVVRTGKLARAGEALGVNYTTIARRIARAETALDQTLFERLPDGYRATEAGRLVAEHAAAMEARQDELLRQLTGQDQSLQGTLVITAPQLLVGRYLAPVIERFNALHPAVEIHLRATNDLLDLNRREADLAIRISRNPGDTLMGLRLCAQQTASFAAPKRAEILERDPASIIDWIAHSGNPEVPKSVRDTYPNVRVRTVFDDMVAMVGAAQAGLGVVRMPFFLGRFTPGLVRVPLLAPQPYADIWVVAHRDVWPSAKVSAFRMLLIDWFRQNKSDFVA